MQRNFNQMHEFCIPRGTVLTFLGVIAGSKSLRPMWNFFRILCTKNYSERLIFDWFIPEIIGGSFWDSIGLFAHKLWSTVVWSIDTIAWNWNCSLRTVFRTCSFGWFLRASASPTTDVLPTLSCGLQTQTAEANLPESSRLYSWRYALVVSVLLVLLHITPVLRQLHWLPVRQRIHYKLASLAFRALSGLAPDYLAGDCQLVGDSGLRSLQSTERRVCSVPRQNSTFGDRSFAAAGPRASNELPFNLRDTALSLTVFNAQLKTHLFSISCGATAHLWHLWFLCAAYKCTYLLTYLLLTVRITHSRYSLSQTWYKCATKMTVYDSEICVAHKYNFSHRSWAGGIRKFYHHWRNQTSFNGRLRVLDVHLDPTVSRTIVCLSNTFYFNGHWNQAWKGPMTESNIVQAIF